MSSEPDIDNLDLVHWSPKRGPTSGGMAALVTIAVGASLVGALAVGALAIGAVAIGRLALGRADLADVRIGRLVVDDLVVRKRSSHG